MEQQPAAAPPMAPCGNQGALDVAVPRHLGTPPRLLSLEGRLEASQFLEEEASDPAADSPSLLAVVHAGDWRLSVGGRGCSKRLDAVCEALRSAGQRPRGRFEALHSLLLARACAKAGEVVALVPTDLPPGRPGEVREMDCGWCRSRADCWDGTWKGEAVSYCRPCWQASAEWALEDVEFACGCIPCSAQGVEPARLPALQPAGFVALSVFREDRRPRNKQNAALVYMVVPDSLDGRLSLVEFLGLLRAVGEGVARLLAHFNASRSVSAQIGRCRICLPDVDSLHPEAMKAEATAALLVGLLGQEGSGARFEFMCDGSGAFGRAWDHLCEAGHRKGTLQLPLSPSASGTPLQCVRFLHRTDPCTWEKAAARLAAAADVPDAASAADLAAFILELRNLGGIVETTGSLAGLEAAAAALWPQGGAGLVLRFCAACTRRLPELFPEGLRLLRRGDARLQLLSRRQCAALLAATICGLVPRQDLGTRSEWVSLPSFDVSGLLGREDSAQQAACVLHFLRELAGAGSAFLDEEFVSFARRAAPWELGVQERAFWAGAPARGRSLGALELAAGRIEEAHGALQADFANRFIGGGVLAGGLAQEEIRFLASPECMVGCLFVEKMQANEAVFIVGALQYSSYRGYWEDFTFTGPAPEAGLRGRPLDQQGRRDVHIVAFDAVSWTRRPREQQYTEAFVRRELVKAHAACLGDPADTAPEPRYLATGNWGCGAFKGDPQLKSLIQWLAASMAGRSIRYYAYGDDRVARLSEVAARVRQSGADCAQLYAALCGCPPEQNIFETVLQRLGA